MEKSFESPNAYHPSRSHPISLQGYSEYLEDLLALIDTPLVDNVKIEYFKEIQVPQLSQFIGRTENLKNAQFRRAM
jgi:hypothetical protein